MAPVAYLLYTRVTSGTTRATPPGPTATASCSRRATGRCCSTHRFTCPGTTCRSTSSSASASGDRRTPGHPERRRHETPGVETTTGRSARDSRTASGWPWPSASSRERYGAEVVRPPRVRDLLGRRPDGGRRRGGGLARRHLGLGRLVYVYDDNHISIDGDTALAFDTRGRRRALPRLRLARGGASRTPTTSIALARALEAAIAEEERPSLIARTLDDRLAGARTRAARPRRTAPRSARRRSRATKEALGWDRRARVPRARRGATRHFGAGRARGAAAQRAGSERFARLARRRPGARRRVGARLRASCPSGLAEALPAVRRGEDEPTSRRGRPAARRCRRSRRSCPTMVGGAADLAVDQDRVQGRAEFSRGERGRNVHFGVREHAMGGDRERHGAARRVVQPVRLDLPRLLRLHASGDPPLRADGPARRSASSRTTRSASARTGRRTSRSSTCAALRAIPGLTVLRPADAAETAEAWRVALEERDGPAVPRPHAPGACPCSIARGSPPRPGWRAAPTWSGREADRAIDAVDRRHRLGGRARPGGRRRS